MPARVPTALVLAVTATVASLAFGATAASATVAAAPPANCRTLPVEADLPLQSDIARATDNVDGTGVKIGILSNTFNQDPTNSTEAQNVADGLLPGPGNPCGYTKPVVVVQDLTQTDPDDEGRGMAQLVHGVAPGAEIFFATGSTTPEVMIDAIQKLVDRGVDIIVDDISFYNEPMFQRSTVSDKIDSVVASGVTYFTAASNETVLSQSPPEGVPSTPVNGWRTSAYRPTTCPQDIVDVYTQFEPTAVIDCMDFDPGVPEDNASTFTLDLSQLKPVPNLAGFVTLTGVMQWGEPFGGATADFELWTSAASQECFPSSDLCRFEFTQTGDPVRNGELVFDTANGTTADMDVSIVRVRTSADAPAIAPAVGFQFLQNGPQYIDAAEYWQSTDTDTVGRTIVGHNGATSAITVAATPFGGDDKIDFYSSLGPVTYYLEPQSKGASAAVLPSPETFYKPTLMSVDGVVNSVLETPDAQIPGAFLFFGTSAATPNAGAVAALALQLDPTLTPTQLRTLLEQTVVPIAQPYPTVSLRDSVGAGLINALNLLNLVAAELPPAPAPAPVPVKPVLADSGAAGVPQAALSAALLLLAGAGLVVARRTLLRRQSR